MKKYIIGILLLGILLFALCGCGGTPLAKAYDSITAQTQGASDDGTHAEQLFTAEYDEEGDVLVIDIQNGAKLKPLFEALNEAVDGKDIGTLIFNLDGTKGDDYEKNLIKKIGKLPCSSLERLGLNFHILNYPSHDWIALAEKTDKLYLNTNYSVFAGYSDKELKKLSKITDIQSAYYSDMRLDGLDFLKGVETFTFVPEYTAEAADTEEPEDPLAKVTEDNPYLAEENMDSAVEVEDTELDQPQETTSEADAEAADLMIFDYFASSYDGVEDIGKLDNLKTMLIFPDTGYKLNSGGEAFIKSVQYLKPDVQINAPGEAGTENLVAITDVKTPNVTEESAAGILAGFLKDDVETIYNECNKYSKKDGDAVLNGKALIYVADPADENWSSKKKFSSIGTVQLTEPEEKGIKVPATVGDYTTFVYIYPTYTRTGVYTSGTKAYSQTLHVQVFDMVDKAAYTAEEVGTEPAPQSFSYFAGSVPDKHSGEVDIKKAYDYLSKLKTK